MVRPSTDQIFQAVVEICLLALLAVAEAGGAMSAEGPSAAAGVESLRMEEDTPVDDVGGLDEPPQAFVNTGDSSDLDAAFTARKEALTAFYSNIGQPAFKAEAPGAVVAPGAFVASAGYELSTHGRGTSGCDTDAFTRGGSGGGFSSISPDRLFCDDDGGSRSSRPALGPNDSRRVDAVERDGRVCLLHGKKLYSSVVWEGAPCPLADGLTVGSADGRVGGLVSLSNGCRFANPALANAESCVTLPLLPLGSLVEIKDLRDAPRGKQQQQHNGKIGEVVDYFHGVKQYDVGAYGMRYSVALQDGSGVEVKAKRENLSLLMALSGVDAQVDGILNTGRAVQQPPPSPGSRFRQPVGCCFGPLGTVVVVDALSHTVSSYRADDWSLVWQTDLADDDGTGGLANEPEPGTAADGAFVDEEAADAARAAAALRPPPLKLANPLHVACSKAGTMFLESDEGKEEKVTTIQNGDRVSISWRGNVIDVDWIESGQDWVVFSGAHSVFMTPSGRVAMRPVFLKEEDAYEVDWVMNGEPASAEDVVKCLLASPGGNDALSNWKGFKIVNQQEVDDGKVGVVRFEQAKAAPHPGGPEAAAAEGAPAGSDKKCRHGVPKALDEVEEKVGGEVELADGTQFRNPTADIYVTDSGNNRVVVLRATDGRVVRHIRVQGMKRPSGIALDPEQKTLAVTDSVCHCVFMVPVDPRKAAYCISGWGFSPGALVNPTGCAFTNDGLSVVVADTENHRVQLLDMDGVLFAEDDAVVYVKGQRVDRDHDVDAGGHFVCWHNFQGDISAAPAEDRVVFSATDRVYVTASGGVDRHPAAVRGFPVAWRWNEGSGELKDEPRRKRDKPCDVSEIEWEEPCGPHFSLLEYVTDCKVRKRVASRRITCLSPDDRGPELLVGAWDYDAKTFDAAKKPFPKRLEASHEIYLPGFGVFDNSAEIPRSMTANDVQDLLETEDGAPDDRGFEIESVSNGNVRFKRGEDVFSFPNPKGCYLIRQAPREGRVEIETGHSFEQPMLTFMGKFGEKGTEDGQLEDPSAVCVDAVGNILVEDRTRVQVFSPEGKHLRTILHLDNDGWGGLAVQHAGNVTSIAVVEDKLCRCHILTGVCNLEPAPDVQSGECKRTEQVGIDVQVDGIMGTEHA